MGMDAKAFALLGEPFAAGFFEEQGRSKFYRFSMAYRRWWENCPLTEYDGGPLYPCGLATDGGCTVVPAYSFTLSVSYDRLQAKGGEEAKKLIRDEMDVLRFPPTPHTVGGYCFTHSIPNYGRVVHEGLDRYRERVEALPAGDFRDGLLCILEGIYAYHTRCVEKLKAEKAPAHLLELLERVPFKPARTLEEGIFCWNFIYYIDGCDNPGRMDADLIDLYRGEDAVPLFDAFFRNVDTMCGWSMAVGPEYNALSLQILRAVSGKRRPSIELRVREDMPQELWNAAAESLRTGCGQPAFYNEALFQQGLKEHFPYLSEADRLRFNGGGCTETMLAGISRVGSLDAGINTALVFTEVMDSLPEAKDFGDFFESVIEGIRKAVDDTLDKVNIVYKQRAEEVPQPVRTLLIDDCIDNGLDFNAGGARANWGVVNFAGTVNVIDSLLAIREIVFDKKEMSPEAFLTAMKAEDETLFARLRRCPCYGVGDKNADKLAADFIGRVFDLLRGKKPYIGTEFLPSSIQFVTYADAGKGVPATPDGRRNGEPLNDSMSAVHNKDVCGPTAMLCSAAALPLGKAVGTPVLNLRLRKDHVEKVIKSLVEGFFEQGGMQVQVSCLDRAELEDAMEHPEKHENLVVRIGGYSEYFNRLSPDLKRTVIERTEH